MEKILEYSMDSLSAFVSNLFGRTMEAENISSVLTEEELGNEKQETSPVEEYRCVQDFFDSDFGTENDSTLKKIVAAATVVAKHLNEEEVPNNSFAIASMVDEGLNKLKVAQKVAANAIDADDAVDKLVDLAVARVSTAIDEATSVVKEAIDGVVETTVPAAVETACAWLENAFPPSRFVTPIVRTVTPYITEKTRQIVRNGIDIVASAAIEVIKSVTPTVKEWGKKLMSFVFG